MENCPGNDMKYKTNRETLTAYISFTKDKYNKDDELKFPLIKNKKLTYPGRKHLIDLDVV
jgi:hypothetical protein